MNFHKGDRVEFQGHFTSPIPAGAQGTVSKVATGRGHSVYPDPCKLMVFVDWDDHPAGGEYRSAMHKVQSTRYEMPTATFTREEAITELYKRATKWGGIWTAYRLPDDSHAVTQYPITPSNLPRKNLVLIAKTNAAPISAVAEVEIIK